MPTNENETKNSALASVNSASHYSRENNSLKQLNLLLKENLKLEHNISKIKRSIVQRRDDTDSAIRLRKEDLLRTARKAETLLSKHLVELEKDKKILEQKIKALTQEVEKQKCQA